MSRIVQWATRERVMRREVFLFFSMVAMASASAGSALAGTFVFSGNSVDGHAVSGSADFALNAGGDTVTVTLTNTTSLTLDAGELFTGIDFSLGGLVPTMTSDTGIQRTVDSAGAYSDTGSAQNLSWSLVSLGGGDYQLNFNPDAKDSIIGPPNGGNYSAANSSIKDNNGHNPFAAEVATFVLSVPGLETNTATIAKVFRYGTELDPATGKITPPTGGGVPEPSTLLLLAATAVGCLVRGRLR